MNTRTFELFWLTGGREEHLASFFTKKNAELFLEGYRQQNPHDRFVLKECYGQLQIPVAASFAA